MQKQTIGMEIGENQHKSLVFMNKESHGVVWLLYGNGVDSAQAFSPNQDPRGLAGSLTLAIRNAGFSLGFTNNGSGLHDVAAILSWDASPHILANLAHYPREKCLLIAFEPPAVSNEFYTQEAKAVFGKIFTLFEDLVDGETYFKFHFPIPESCWEIPTTIPDFSDKKLAATVHGNKYFRPDSNEIYSERKKAVKELSLLGEFDVYGLGWASTTSWKGELPHSGFCKRETIKNYRFILAYENTGNRPGHVTDKIHPVLVARSVPIYLGASNITDYVPKECFIDKREFSSYLELHSFIKSVDQKDYDRYLDAGFRYLTQDPKRDFFTVDYLVRMLMKHLCKT